MAVKNKTAFIQAENLSLEFPVKLDKSRGDKTHTQQVGGRLTKLGTNSVLTAVRNLNFRLEKGSRLGIIGPNGAGKTTMLRLMAGIYTPTSGKVIHSGKRGNGLNIGIGFRNEASGRRNIVLKALIGGCKRADIDNFVRDVEEFAQLGDFLDLPLRTYSQGMRARLAFGIATAFRNDILLLDEWLGAGDRNFQRRAGQRMNAMVNETEIVMLATHNRTLLSNSCNLCLVMQQGAQMFMGSVEEGLAYYDEMMDATAAKPLSMMTS